MDVLRATSNLPFLPPPLPHTCSPFRAFFFTVLRPSLFSAVRLDSTDATFFLVVPVGGRHPVLPRVETGGGVIKSKWGVYLVN